MQIVFTDGLGNQMFQYALYLAMCARGCKPILNIGIITRNVVHNGFELCEDFEINKQKIRVLDGGCLGGGMTMFILRYMKFLCYEELGKFRPTVFQTKRLLISGYWQDIRYFETVQDEVRRAFTFRNIDERNLCIGEEMDKINSVSLHIRRGDYLKYPQYQVCTPSYYKKAITIIKEKVENPIFYVFSDDLNWSNQFMSGQGVNYKIVSLNRGRDSYKDMYLMTRCRHNIIANSSFSWWGAWLNNNVDKIVISPLKWNLKNENSHPQLNDWIKIDS